MFLKKRFWIILNMVLFKRKQAVICCKNPEFVENSSRAKMLTFTSPNSFFTKKWMHFRFPMSGPILGLPLVALSRSETSQGYLCSTDSMPWMILCPVAKSVSPSSISSTSPITLFSSFIEFTPSPAWFKPHIKLRLFSSSTVHDISSSNVSSYIAFSFVATAFFSA